MIQISVKECLEPIKGKLLSGKATVTFNGVSIDSRKLRAGNLFFCLCGPNFDGHDFINEALLKKAAVIVVSDQKKLPVPLPVSSLSHQPVFIAVEDTISAVQNLAHYYRKGLNIQVIAITGTNGKSSTKEMTAEIVKTRFKTSKTKGNLNNHIGLPLSILDLEQDHEAAVLEMGMSAAGEIERLAEIARPQIGVITNISEGHLVHLKSLKNIQRAKGELFESLPPDGTAVINADDPLVLELSRSVRANKITFGIDSPADVRAKDIQMKPNSGFDFTVDLLGKEFSIRLPFLGYFNIYNALAAMAASFSLGLKPGDMDEGLSHCKLLSQRHEILEHNSMTIINDAYNANPKSMREAISTLSRYKSTGRRFFVIGDMLELGSLAESAHMKLGEEIANHSIDVLVTVGELASLAAESAGRTGMEPGRIRALSTKEEAVDYLNKNARPGDCLLFKGSRGMKMEEVIHALMNKKTP